MPQAEFGVFVPIFRVHYSTHYSEVSEQSESNRSIYYSVEPRKSMARPSWAETPGLTTQTEPLETADRAEAITEVTRVERLLEPCSPSEKEQASEAHRPEPLTMQMASSRGCGPKTPRSRKKRPADVEMETPPQPKAMSRSGQMRRHTSKL